MVTLLANVTRWPKKHLQLQPSFSFATHAYLHKRIVILPTASTRATQRLLRHHMERHGMSFNDDPGSRKVPGHLIAYIYTNNQMLYEMAPIFLRCERNFQNKLEDQSRKAESAIWGELWNNDEQYDPVRYELKHESESREFKQEAERFQFARQMIVRSVCLMSPVELEGLTE